MAFWSSPNQEPKLSYRWYASFGFSGGVVNSYTIRSFQKPSFEIATSEYIWLNDVAYRPGLISWNPVEITLTDGEGMENNTLNLNRQLQQAGYQNTNVNAPRNAIEKRKASRALGGDMRLTQIDARGRAIEEWQLVAPFITTVNFGQANYGVEEIMTISLAIRYDYAIHSIL